MHHRKVRTSGKKESKRIEHKQIRRAEDQALGGGHIRTIRGYRWGKLDQPSLPDDTPVPQRKKRKKRKPKEGCLRNPNGSHHDYLRDTEVIENKYERWSHRRQNWYWDTYRIERKYKLCVWCDKEVVLKRRYLG